jgi:hypothetical protein
MWIAKNLVLDTVEICLFRWVICKRGWGLLFVVNCINWVLLKFIEGRFVFNHSLIRLKAVVTFSSKSLLLGLVIKMVVSSANNNGIAMSFGVLGKSLM